MSKYLLAILVPTTPDRRKEYSKLRDEFNRQRIKYGLIEKVSISYMEDDKTMTLGEKRELMYKNSNGEYSIQWDSDDWISEDGLYKLVKALEENLEVDCVTFNEYCLMNNVEYKSRHSIEYGGWEGDGNRLFEDGFHYHRTPFYKNVIKTSIAQSVPFKYIRFGEDHEFSNDLKPKLKTEIHLEESIYHYIHNSTDFNERYGFNNQHKADSN